MSRLAEMVRPDICIMTKIGYSHLETLGDLNGVLRAKSEVFAFMGPDGVAVLNGDDELLRECDPQIRKITYGFDEQNDFRAVNIRQEGIASVTCDIVTDTGRFPLNIPAYGNHLALAALPAVVTGLLLGMTGEDIKRGIKSYLPVGGRANVSDTGYITLINDCYNANPNSVRAALSSLSGLRERRVAILGDMLELGEMSDALHSEIGAFAARSMIDSLICCGDKASSIYDGFNASGGAGARYFMDKSELIAALPDLIKKGDAVLVKASHSIRFEEIVSALEKMRG